MTKLDINSKYRMLSGHEIPVLGFGVDSARMYRNEGPCAAAMKKSGLPRSDLFFTTKVYTKDMGYDKTKESIAASLKETGLDYIDLYLIHAPYGGRDARLGSWRALVEAQSAGQIRSIGVSNYGIHHLEELQSYIAVLEAEHGKGKGGQISVGQWELHPWLERKEIAAWCREKGVVCEAYSPVVQGTRFEEKVLQPLVKKYGKTPAQVLLRWSLQKGFVPLPKSVTPSRIEENTQVFDFALSPEEMKSLETGDYAPVCWDPTTSKD
ncbi:MAG: hypothetical protein Q9187_001731 [Circinaria calcarea]